MIAASALFDAWATALWRACWEGGLLVLAVWLVCRLIPSMPARFQCWFWRLALLKFMMVLLCPTLLNLPLLPALSVAVPVPEAGLPVATEMPTSSPIFAPTIRPTVSPTIPMDRVSITPSRTIAPPSVRTAPPRVRIALPSVRAILCFVWLIGVGWSLACLLTAWHRARQLRKQCGPIDCVPLVEQLAIQGRLFGLRHSPALLEVPGCGSPMLIGIFRPAILLPTETYRRLTAAERTMVLGHELAHIRRGDVFWRLVAVCVRATFFFHPLVWLSHWRLSLAQEIAADQLTIAQQKHDPIGYGKLLVAVVEKFGPRRLISSLSVGTMEPVESLTRRLVAMMWVGRVSRRMVAISAVLLAITVVLGLVPWRLVAAEPKAPTEPAKATAEIKKSGGRFSLERGFATGAKPPPIPLVGAASEYLKGLTQSQYLNLANSRYSFSGSLAVGTNESGTYPNSIYLGGTGWGRSSGIIYTGSTGSGSSGSASGGSFTVTCGGSSSSGSTSLSASVASNRGGSVVMTGGTSNWGTSSIGTCSTSSSGSAPMVLVGDTTIQGPFWMTDAGLQYFKELTQLRELNLFANFMVSDIGLKELQEALPNRKIVLPVVHHVFTAPSPASVLTAELKVEQAKAIAEIKKLRGEVVLGNGFVVAVDFRNTRITDVGLEHLKGLTQLQKLDLSFTGVTDAGLEHIEGLTNLRELGLHGTNVTNVGLEHLKGLTNIEVLDLQGTRITDGGLEHLKGLTKLQSLTLVHTHVTGAGLQRLQGLTNLERLTLWPLQFCDVGLKHVKELTKLQSLSLSCNVVSNAGQMNLSGLTNLEKLTLWGFPYGGFLLKDLKGLTKLQSLTLVNAQVTDAGLTNLSGLTTLQSLILPFAHVTDAGLEHVKSLTNLETLDLMGTQVTDAGLEHLQGLTHLRCLDLGDTKVTDAGLERLQGLTQLRRLDLRDTKVTDAGLERLQGLTNLETLELVGLDVTDAGLEHLKGLTQLQFLYLGSTKVTDSGVKDLQKALPTTKIIR